MSFFCIRSCSLINFCVFQSSMYFVWQGSFRKAYQSIVITVFCLLDSLPTDITWVTTAHEKGLTTEQSKSIYIIRDAKSDTETFRFVTAVTKSFTTEVNHQVTLKWLRWHCLAWGVSFHLAFVSIIGCFSSLQNSAASDDNPSPPVSVHSPTSVVSFVRNPHSK